MTVVFNAATAANVSILQRTNSAFQLSQKRVSTGKMIFGAADDATRYKMSEVMLGRSRQLDAVNNNVSLALKTLDATDKTLKQMINLVEAAQDLARKAQAEGAAGTRGATSTANLQATTVVGGVAVNDRFSITSDTGETFTYTFLNTSTNWGTVADALNSANIGVLMEFVPGSAANTTNIRFSSNNGKDFKFNSTSDAGVMTVLAGLTSPGTGATYTPANLFVTGTAVPTATQTGYTIAFGGSITTTKAASMPTNQAIASGSTLVFLDGNGDARTFTAGTGETATTMMNTINSLNAGVRVSLENQLGAGIVQMRIRNTNGGDMAIVGASGDFVSGGVLGFPGVQTNYAAPLSSNNALRLRYGQQYDAIVTNLTLLAQNNPVQAGRNLLQGQSMNVVMDEFGGNPINIAGIAITATGTLTMAQGGFGWTTDAAIQTSATQSNQAILNLRDYQAQFSTFNSYMQDRYDTNKSYGVDLKTAGDELVAADVSEESAKLSALQTQQQFAVQAFSMGTQNAQSLLRLLG